MLQGSARTIASRKKVLVWIIVEYTLMIRPILSCDVVTQELPADSNWKSFTSVGYNEGSGSYINNMDCWWRIDSGADDLRLLLFLTFDTACPGDKIDIYDGNSTSATVLANNKCGTPASPSHYSTTQRYAYIRMVTDADVQKAGFKMEFLAAKDYSGTGCTSVQALSATDAIQILTSPNFPGLYSNSQNCRWVITSTTGSVDLDVVFSDVEDDNPSQCNYDKYYINDGNDRCDNNVISTVCSQYPKVAPFALTSSGSSVVVSFVSDFSVGRHGFLMKYKSNVTKTTTTAHTTESTQTTSTDLNMISKHSSTCIDIQMVIGIVSGSLVVVMFSYTFIVLIIIRSYNIQLKTVKPKD